MGYFDNHDNRLLNKYKKILKIDFFLQICSFTYRVVVFSNFMQFHYLLIVHQRTSKFYIIYNGSKFQFNQTIMKLHKI
jgi:hypothetical protein